MCINISCGPVLDPRPELLPRQVAAHARLGTCVIVLLYIYIYICVSTYIYIYICVWVCVYIYIYIS